MTSAEKLSRTAWITYLIAGSPMALFCAAMTLISIRFLFIDDAGPVEEPPLPNLQKVVFWCSMITFQVAWILGFTVAHRFNGKTSRTIPFVANILPMSGLLWFALILTSEEGREFFWMVFYTVGLLALLAIGMVAVLFSARQRP
jgi:hypothetical protein